LLSLDYHCSDGPLCSPRFSQSSTKAEQQTGSNPSLGFVPARTPGAFVLQLFRSITPGAELRHSRLKPFRSETEAELPLFRVNVDQYERSGFELLQSSQRLDARKNAVARFPALDGRVLVNSKDCPGRKRFSDNPHIPSLKHDDERERAPRSASGLPKRHRDRAVRSTNSGSGTAFGDPLVGSEFLSCDSPWSAQHLNATDKQDDQGGMKFSAAHHLMSYCRPRDREISRPLRFCNIKSSPMISALLTLGLTKPLKGGCVSSCQRQCLQSLNPLKVVGFGSI
jgi:hypothetical protein